jgi:hypothetical protein
LGELLIDVSLVCIYFFLVQGAEQLVTADGVTHMQGASAEVEALWVMAMFWTYVLWDIWTKARSPRVLLQRSWSSVACALLSVGAYYFLAGVRESLAVIFADTSLLALVLLFRALKLHDFSNHTKFSWLGSAALLCTGFAFAIAARYR